MSDFDSRAVFGSQEPWHQRWHVLNGLIECVAVTLFVFAAGAAGATSGDNAIGHAVCSGFVVGALVYATSKTSGGHLNPAVTLAFLVTRNIPWRQAVTYAIFQMIGSLLSGLMLLGALPQPWGALGATTLSPGVTVGNALMWEFVTTFTLVYVVFGAAMRPRGETQGRHIPLAVALVVTAGALASGNYTGGSMNPARTFGPLVAASIGGQTPAGMWDGAYIYLIAPMAAGVAAAFVAKFTNARPLGKDYVVRDSIASVSLPAATVSNSMAQESYQTL